MKLARRALTLAVLLGFGGLGPQAATPANADPVEVELFYNANVPEMQGIDYEKQIANPASGVARVDVEAGIVRVRVRNLPKDAVTGKRLPVTLTDLVNGTAVQATGYEAWLLRVDEPTRYHFVVADGVSLGMLRVRTDGTGVVEYRAGGLQGRGFNMVAVTAETDAGPHVWAPDDPAWVAFTWNGSNGMIVLWSGLLAPFE